MTLKEFSRLVWKKLKGWGKLAVRYLLAPGVALLVVVGALILFKVEYIPPGQAAPVKVRLPEGVRNTDVKEIVMVAPEVVAVTVHDSSKVTVTDVKNLLDKYKKR